MIPSLFIGHGSPMLAIQKTKYTDFLGALAQRLPKPKAILIFSAHWEASVQAISAVEHYNMIYDFWGFPESLYNIVYPAYGDATIAKQVETLFHNQGIPCSIDKRRGLDHGAWVVLSLLYPKADIPVISLSVNPQLSPEEQYKIGIALSSLRKENILIIGSGGTVHNLRQLTVDDSSSVSAWAIEFDQWIETQIYKWDLKNLFEYEKQAPHAHTAVPRNEHFIPLLIAMGAGDDTKKPSLLHLEYEYGSLSMACWQFE